MMRKEVRTPMSGPTDDPPRVVQLYRRVRNPDKTTYRRMIAKRRLPATQYKDKKFFTLVLTKLKGEYPDCEIEAILCNPPGFGLIGWERYLNLLEMKEQGQI